MPKEGGEKGNGLLTMAALGVADLGGRIWDSIRSAKTARYNTDATIAANKAAAELAYQRDIEKWHMQNAYNSPEAQMERFKAAGLNPNLIYGQGSPGNAQSYPQYHPAPIRYQYESGHYGAAISNLLPTMMQVGSWIQDMRLKDQQLKMGDQQMDTRDLQQLQLKQLITYLEEKNPKLLKEMDNKLSLFPYQSEMTRTAMNASNAKLQEFLHEVNFRWQPGGQKDLTLEQLRRNLAASGFKNKLLEAQSSWSDLDITNPQGLMQMVLGGAMGLLGQQLRLSTGKLNQKRKVTETESIKRVGRTRTTKTERYVD